MRSKASSQEAGRNSPSFPSRRSGLVSRSECPSKSVEVHPFWHNPPLFVGKSRASTRAFPFSTTIFIPHCNAQYGQCVAVTIVAGRWGRTSSVGSVDAHILLYFLRG